MLITKQDLYNNQYDYITLKTNIYAVSLLDILKTQRLTADFCVKYILNEDFQILDEDQNISLDMVKKYQQHISDSDLERSMIKANDKKLKYERIDSFEDFETYMNRNN
jgi:hypothetical protein